MSSTLSLILIVIGAYLAAHVASRWVARRFLIVSGAEYLLLGVLLGPQLSRIISAEAVSGFAPFLTLALGWIGAVVGAQFYLPDLLRFKADAYRMAFGEAILTGAAVAGAMVLCMSWVFDIPPQQALIPALVMGSIATASSPAGIALVGRKLGNQGAVVRQIQLTTAIDALVAITVFGLLFAFDHHAPAGGVRPLTATEWAVVTIAIGCVGGALFHLFLGTETKIDRLFIGLAGAVILASGAAAYLRLSPLVPTMLIGAILINTSSSRKEIRQTLSSIERPIYFVLLIFAGAAWQPSTRAWVIPVVVFLVSRTLMKMYATALVTWANDSLPALGPAWGRALLGQGGLAVAIGLNYVLHDRSFLPHLVFTATLISVLLTDLTSARVAESVVGAAKRHRAAGATPRRESVPSTESQEV
ncbi:MAG: cation:proton antiporter [Gemmatimonadetes bacterium]|nr:cation:proton antiporter [Gemmatimonadota bacterium]